MASSRSMRHEATDTFRSSLQVAVAVRETRQLRLFTVARQPDMVLRTLSRLSFGSERRAKPNSVHI